MGQQPHVSDSRARGDRSLGLAVVGVVEILIGLGLAVLTPLGVIALRLAGADDLRVALPTAILNTILAVTFIALGIGSVRARRWAVELSLSLAWVWLITGVCSLLLTWLLAATLWPDLALASGLPSTVAVAVGIAIYLLLATVYVALPGGLVLFFRSPEVAATCRRRNPDPGWIGRCPRPLLALATAYAIGGLSVLVMPAYGFVFPIFGTLASGAVGAACWVGVLVLSAVLVWGTCRRRGWAWWLAMAGTIAAAASSVATFVAVDAETVLGEMHLPPDQRLVIEQLWPGSPWAQVAIWLGMWGSLAAYLGVVKPHFDGGRASEPPNDGHVKPLDRGL